MIHFEQLMLDKAGREFTVSAGWIPPLQPDDLLPYQLLDCLGEGNESLAEEAFEEYQALKPQSAQERWEVSHRRAPAFVGWCEVSCAWCAAALTQVERQETRANRRCRMTEATAAVIVRHHLWSCPQIQMMLEAVDAPVGDPTAVLLGGSTRRRGADRATGARRGGDLRQPLHRRLCPDA